jgi:DNA-binding CsgD family transcriptional regulator
MAGCHDSPRAGRWVTECFMSSFAVHAAEIGGRPLTRRERQILDLLLSGRTNREIALRLGTSEHTIKVQLGKLYAKVGVKNRLQLALRVLRR